MRARQGHRIAVAVAGLWLAAALAQTAADGATAAPAPAAASAASAAGAAASASTGRPLRPLTLTSIAPVLERAIGAPIAAPATRGQIDLHGKRFYIAEYLLLFEVGGEIAAATKNGRIFGQRQGVEQVSLAYATTPDIAALQALTDRLWADLQLRLARAGVSVTPAEQIVPEYGAVYTASEAPSAPGKPVYYEARSGESLRRYLVLAPSGMKVVPRGLTGVGVGNLSARLAYPAKGVEAVSLAIAVNTTGLDGVADRVSTFIGSDDMYTLSPLLEVRPAPASALVHAHAQLALVNLDEALVLDGEFARIRRTTYDAAATIPPNEPLRLLGKTLDNVVGSLFGQSGRGRGPITGAGADGQIGTAIAERKRVPVLLELDGPALARMMLYGVSAANEAIAETLRSAQLSFKEQFDKPQPPAASR